ncbi:MAG: hypothetical protein WC699_02580 [Bacteroidales bacterium]|jgi:hypothetical protein
MKTTSIKTIALICLVTVLSGCWSKKYDYAYNGIINNATGDTLKMVFGKKINNISQFGKFNTYTLFPNDTLWYDKNDYFQGYEIPEGMEPVQAWINLCDWDTVLVFRNDTLKALWSLPVFSGPCTENNFFNSQSWRTWLIDEYGNGWMMFTIHPSDLTLNGY